MDDLKNIARLNIPKHLNFDQILRYLEIIKNYQHLSTKPYHCEWIEPITLTKGDIEEILLPEENLPAGLKVGNVNTYNYKKVSKVI